MTTKHEIGDEEQYTRPMPMSNHKVPCPFCGATLLGREDEGTAKTLDELCDPEIDTRHPKAECWLSRMLFLESEWNQTLSAHCRKTMASLDALQTRAKMAE